jgi:hypothetical protein
MSEQQLLLIKSYELTFLLLLLLFYFNLQKKIHMCSVNGILFDVINQRCKDVYIHDYIV